MKTPRPPALTYIAPYSLYYRSLVGSNLDPMKLLVICDTLRGIYEINKVEISPFEGSVGQCHKHVMRYSGQSLCYCS